MVGSSQRFDLLRVLIGDGFVTGVPERSVKLKHISITCAEWFQSHGRRYPWRQSDNPYHILLAEFLLRKTQVFRVLPVFTTLINRYPTLYELAKADPLEVRNIIAPLGLPERGPQLVEIARALISNGEGIESGSQLMQFKGVGPYIANAIECMAFQRPAPLVDGAVGRLIRRVFGIRRNKAAYADKSLWELAGKILQSTSQNCKDVSLGMLDIAAIYCKVKKPACVNCPLGKFCVYNQSSDA